MDRCSVVIDQRDGFDCQKQVSRAVSVGCNYLSLSLIPASGTSLVNHNWCSLFSINVTIYVMVQPWHSVYRANVGWSVTYNYVRWPDRGQMLGWCCLILRRQKSQSTWTLGGIVVSLSYSCQALFTNVTSDRIAGNYPLNPATRTKKRNVGKYYIYALLLIWIACLSL